MNSLKIKDGYIKVYAIEETGISLKHFVNKKLPTEENYPFENIKSDRFFHVARSPLYLILTGLFLIMCVIASTDGGQPKTGVNFVAAAIFFAFAVFGVLLYFLFCTKVFFFKTFTGKFIRFRVKHNEVEISNFIENALNKRNDYINMKYGVPRQYLSYDGQYSNFGIMLKERMISEQEYLQKVSELNKIFDQTKPKQIFQTYSQN